MNIRRFTKSANLVGRIGLAAVWPIVYFKMFATSVGVWVASAMTGAPIEFSVATSRALKITDPMNGYTLVGLVAILVLDLIPFVPRVIQYVHTSENAASKAIAAGAPTANIAKRLDRGLFPTAFLFTRAARSGRTDVLELLFDAARPKGQAVIDDGVRAALSSCHAFDTIDMARLVLAHSTPDVLNRHFEGFCPGSMATVWHEAFIDAALPQDLNALLVLLREHGADLARSPISDLGETNGGEHGEALRAFLIAERVEHERALLAQAADEALIETAPAPRRARL